MKAFSIGGCVCLASCVLLILQSAERLFGVPPIEPVRSKQDIFFVQPDFVGIVQITKVPTEPAGGFRASFPPMVVAKLITVLKGEPKLGTLRILWQTHLFGDDVRAPSTVRIHAPGVNEEFMVYLRKKGDAYERLDAGCSFHKMPAGPNVSVRYLSGWRGVTEVSPFLSKPGEPVQYRFCRTREDLEPWTGQDWNLSASNLTVIDVTRKKLLSPKNPAPRHKVFVEVGQGHSIVHRIELNRFFDIQSPGEYWVLLPEQSVLRFEVSDRILMK